MNDFRSSVEPHDISVPTDWADEEKLIIPDEMPKSRTHPFLKKFLSIAFIFLFISIAIALYMFFGGGNSVSSNNVDIAIVGPAEVASGEEVDLGVSLVNQNSTDLQAVVWTVIFPDGARGSKDSSEPLKQTTESIGTIGRGSKVDRNIKTYLFGEKGETKTIQFKIEYQIKGSNATFVKQKNYDMTIGSSPLLLEVSIPKEINSGQDMDMQVTVSSNSTALLQNVLVKAEYPYGFSFENSSITSGQNGTLWNLGDLKAGDKKKFTISGQLIAQDNEERTFRFSAGQPSPSDPKNIATILGNAMPTVVVKKSFIDTTLVIAGNSDSVVSLQSGTQANATLTFQNTLPDKLSNVSVSVKISGVGLDRQAVQANSGGFYQSANDTILWDKNSTPVLSQIDPSDSKQLSFSFGTLALSPNTKNPTINISVVVKGTRSLQGGDTETVTQNLTKTIKIISLPTISAKTMRGGVIANSGPLPPKAEQASTYTINWVLTNKYNDLTNVMVKADLPQGVDWTGIVSPTTENITYNSDVRQVTWNPNTLSAGSGFVYSTKQVSFQVKIIPSLSQVGSVPQLSTGATLSATDAFAGVNVNAVSSAVTTETSDGISGIVVK
jgi:hypothetical protein